MISLSEVTIVTPCVRPKNIIPIFNSIKIASSRFDDRPYWHVVFDTGDHIDTYEDNIKYTSHKNRESIYGNSQRNFGLQKCTTKFITFLDDDTILHPDYFNMIHHLLVYNKVVVVGQQLKNGATRLVAHPNNVKVCHIDTSQLLFPTSILKEFSWSNEYSSDGILAEEVYRKYHSDFLFFNSNLSIYNALQ